MGIFSAVWEGLVGALVDIIINLILSAIGFPQDAE